MENRIIIPIRMKMLGYPTPNSWLSLVRQPLSILRSKRPPWMDYVNCPELRCDCDEDPGLLLKLERQCNPRHCLADTLYHNMPNIC